MRMVAPSSCHDGLRMRVVGKPWNGESLLTNDKGWLCAGIAEKINKVCWDIRRLLSHNHFNRLLVVMYLPARLVAPTRPSWETISMQAISLQGDSLGYEWLHTLPWKSLAWSRIDGSFTSISGVASLRCMLTWKTETEGSECVTLGTRRYYT